MSQLDTILADLEPRHRAVLAWFHAHTGQEVPWDITIDVNGEETFLTSRAKGIYKPKWSDYAVSVREGIKGDYNDLPPYKLPDGTWLYMYHQEDRDPDERDRWATNRGLMKCHASQVPVGVIKQVKLKPNPRYLIRGLAFVRDWNDGYFFLEGSSNTDGYMPEWMPEDWTREQRSILDRLIEDADMDPSLITDERIRRLSQSVIRPGQQRFRRQLLTIYHGVCAISGCEIEQVLQAAHIAPYQGVRSDALVNGLLLRADLHLLFDDHLVTVDPEAERVLVAPSLRRGHYAELHGQPLVFPHQIQFRPSRAALGTHRQRCGF